MHIFSVNNTERYKSLFCIIKLTPFFLPATGFLVPMVGTRVSIQEKKNNRNRQAKQVHECMQNMIFNQ